MSAQTPPPESSSASRASSEAAARHWRSVRSVDDLLERRADLQGLAPMAELIRDAVRWAA